MWYRGYGESLLLHEAISYERMLVLQTPFLTSMLSLSVRISGGMKMEGIGKRIRLERLRLGLSQAKFAFIGGVEVNAQGHYESGYRKPRVDYLYKVAVAGVDIGFLVTGIRPQSIPERVQFEKIPACDEETTVYPTAAQSDAQFVRHLHRSLDHIGQALVDLHKLVNQSDQRSPADHIREYLIISEAEVPKCSAP